MRALGIALAVLVLALPVASADTPACAAPAPGVVACAGEGSGAAGSCEEKGYAYGYDTAFVFTPAAILVAYAGHSCAASPTFEQEATSVQADAFTPLFAVQLQWAHVAETSTQGGAFEACTVQIVLGTSLGWNGLTQPCPAGAAPPDPGWGRLLP